MFQTKLTDTQISLSNSFRKKFSNMLRLVRFVEKIIHHEMIRINLFHSCWFTFWYKKLGLKNKLWKILMKVLFIIAIKFFNSFIFFTSIFHFIKNKLSEILSAIRWMIYEKYTFNNSLSQLSISCTWFINWFYVITDK